MAICEQERVGQSGVHPQETAKQNTGGRLTRDRCSDGGSTALFEAEGAKMRSKNSIGQGGDAAASRHGSKRRRDGSETMSCSEVVIKRVSVGQCKGPKN